MVPFMLGVGSGILAALAIAAVLHRRRAVGSTDGVRIDLESRLEAAEQEQATRDGILAALDEGVVLFDPDGVVRYRNPRVDQLLGARVGEETNLLPPELRALVDGTRN